MPLATRNTRKAALLVRSLDTDSAALLLAQLSPQEAREVRRAVRELGEIDPEEQAELALELRRTDPQPEIENGGVELDFQTHGLASDHVPTNPGTPPSAEAQDVSPFAWLEHGDLPTLANVLEREHLSTVAVVLSHLPAERAAELLLALAPERRAAALERLADLGESDRASLEVIEKSLADWIARQKRQRQLRADRVQAIHHMLKYVARDAREAVLAELNRSDSHLAREIDHTRRERIERNPLQRPLVPRARQVTQLFTAGNHIEPDLSVDCTASHTGTLDPLPPPKPPQIEFGQIASLSRQDLAILMRQTDPQTLVYALAGGSDEVMRHVIQQLPSEVGRELTRRVNHLSQVRLSEVAKAQETIAIAAAKLMAARQTATPCTNLLSSD